MASTVSQPVGLLVKLTVVNRGVPDGLIHELCLGPFPQRVSVRFSIGDAIGPSLNSAMGRSLADARGISRGQPWYIPDHGRT